MMAGEWLKIEHSTPDKPEVGEIAQILGIKPDAVMGKLIRVWAWASQNCHGDGVTSVTVLSTIDRIAGKKGFAKSMQKVKWLRIKITKNQQKLIFANFDYHMSKSAKARAVAQKRKQRERDNDKKDVTVLSRSERDKKRTREEKSFPKGKQKKGTGSSADARAIPKKEIVLSPEKLAKIEKHIEKAMELNPGCEDQIPAMREMFITTAKWNIENRNKIPE